MTVTPRRFTEKARRGFSTDGNSSLSPVFYRTDDGSVNLIKSLRELSGSRMPDVVNKFVGLMSCVRNPNIRAALRPAMFERVEVAL